MSDQNKKSSGEDWEFEIDLEEVKQMQQDARGESRSKRKESLFAEPKLKVEEFHHSKRISRTELAVKEGGPKVERPDEFIPANLFLRFLSFLIDIAFAAGIVALSYFLTEPVGIFLEKMFAESKYINIKKIDFEIVFYSEIAFLYLFFAVFPIVMFGKSFGKKIFGLRVRGVSYHNVSLFNGIYRELLLKPIGIITLTSFVIPLFNKRRRGFHDIMSETIVVRETRES